ncbi:hypothetical protein [Streptomyces sp. NBC_00564]|uniref:hypothetical protein n=1 Tax=Streptomyces sp. NBC_00564 TaxID=2903663 RepID=UPI00352E6BD1|nr:hypothetical protein OG256_35715 [Streptomyces sp. NBC_00564]
MSSVTTWQRLEPIPRTDDLRVGLRAEIADPLWMLARQRQFGELRGEDAGSPVVASLELSVGRISRLHLGEPGGDAANLATDHDDTAAPLEVLVEREPVRGAGVDAGVVVSAGLHLLRLLRFHQAPAAARIYLDHYALRVEDLPGNDLELERLRRRAVGRAPDARRLAADLVAHRGSAPELTSLPAAPTIAASDRNKVLAAVNAFLAAWGALLSEPAAGAVDAWVPNRLEHAFAIQADVTGGLALLRADEYRGGRLDWHSFTLAGRPSLGAPATPRPPTSLVRTVLPTPVSYGGMPADRFWEIEDGTVRFGALETGRTDLGRLLLTEFALTYGNDWFVIPVDLPVGSVTTMDRFTVTDTFGLSTQVGPSRSAGFRMFELDAPGGPRRLDGVFFLAPAVADVLESPPTEEVAFFRDELANVVWGVERRFQGGAGTPVDRYEEHQQRLAALQRVETVTPDAQLLYRLMTDVPEHWHPFVPVRAAGVAATPGVIQLERRPLVRIAADGTATAVEPRGRVLTAADPLRLEEEEVPRDGTHVVRTFQLTRWSDGRYHLWSGRHRSTGAGEGSSGLRFDSVQTIVP